MNTQDPLQFIFGRRSIRVYKPGKVSEPTITKLLQAAMAAPSAVARDPWRFVVIQKPDTLAALASHLRNDHARLRLRLCHRVADFPRRRAANQSGADQINCSPGLRQFLCPNHRTISRQGGGQLAFGVRCIASRCRIATGAPVIRTVSTCQFFF